MPAMSTLTSLNDEWLHTGRREFASGPRAGRSAGDVLLIDGDLRRPRLHEVFKNLRGAPARR